MGYTFQGYRRANGKFGARNLVAVIPSVICANDVGQAICRQVQGTIGYFHHQGCCQLPLDLKRVTDTLSNLGQSPNVGAALIVSLGCEGTDHERLVEEIRATGKPVEIIRIQELGGTSRAIQAGIDAAQRLVQQISGLQREPVDISNVVMAIKCGASDTTSGMASNCVIGYVADKLVDLGATVVFGETTEFLGGEHILARRAVGGENGPVGQTLDRVLSTAWRHAPSPSVRICAVASRRRAHRRRSFQHRGKEPWRHRQVGSPSHSGRTGIHRPHRRSERSVDQGRARPRTGNSDRYGRHRCAADAVLDRRGAPQGFPSMPVVKICGNPNTFERMQHDMDLNAGRIITGEKTIEEVGEEAFDLLLRVLSGQMTKNEALGYFGSMDIFCLAR